MKNKIKVVPYFRRNRAEAVIYVRGENKESQEIMCRLYAVDKDYEVSYVTRNINNVNLCNVLLVTEPSRISRNQEECCEIVKKINDKGVKVEYVIN